MWAVYEADGTLNSLWMTEASAARFAHQHAGWWYGYYGYDSEA